MRQGSCRPRAAVGWAALATIVGLASPVHAATWFYDGGNSNLSGNGNGVSAGGSGSWSTTLTNWDPGSGVAYAAWTGSSNSASFGGTAGLVTLGSAVNAVAVNFTPTAGGYVLDLNGFNLGLTGGFSASNTGGTVTVQDSAATPGAVVLGAAQSFANTVGGALTVNTAINTAGYTLTLNAVGTTASSGINLGGAIGGGGTLYKTGTGTAVLTGSNGYAVTTIDAGTLQVGNGGTSGTLGSGAVTVAPATSAATLAFYRSDAKTFSNAIILTAGTFGSANLTADGGGTITLGGPITVNPSSNNVAWTVNANTTLNVTNAVDSQSGASSLFVNGPGTLNFSGNGFAVPKVTFRNGITFNSSGTINIPANSGDAGAYFGIGSGAAGTTATVNVTDGSVTTYVPMYLGAVAAGTLNVRGGTVSVLPATSATPRVQIGDGLADDSNGVGVLTISSGLFTTGMTAGNIYLGNAGSGSGTINLDGGTLATNCLIKPGSYSTTTTGQTKGSVINFNGGTLQATGNTLSIASTVTAKVLAGGAILDENGIVLSVPANFTTGVGSGSDGGLTVGNSAAASGSVTLAGNLGFTGGLTVNAPVTLSGTNTYSGATIVNASLDAKSSSTVFGATGAGNGTTINAGGTVRVIGATAGAPLAIPEAFTLDGGAFVLLNNAASSLSLGGSFTLKADAAIQVNPSAQSNTTTVFSGGFAEGATASSLSFVRNGTAGATTSVDTVVLTAASTYAGSTFVTDTDTTYTTPFALQLRGGNDRLPTGTILTLGGTAGGYGAGGGSGKLVLGDASVGPMSQTLAGLTTSGSGTKNAVVGGNAAASTLTLRIASGINTFAGTLGGAGTNENSIALIKSGAGTLALNGSNTYTGGTTINAGTVQANNAASSLGGGTVDVNSGGTLAGQSATTGVAGKTGNGNVNVNAGGTLSAGTGGAAGDTPGKLAVGGTTKLAGGATVAWKISNPAGSAGTGWDLLSLGTLNVTGSGVTLQLTAGSPAPAFGQAQSFQVLSATAAQTNGAAVNNQDAAAMQAFANLFTLSTNGLNLSDGAHFTLSAAADGAGLDLYANYVPAPEPTTALLLGLGGASLLGRRRRG